MDECANTEFVAIERDWDLAQLPWKTHPHWPRLRRWLKIGSTLPTHSGVEFGFKRFQSHQSDDLGINRKWSSV